MCRLALSCECIVALDSVGVGLRDELGLEAVSSDPLGVHSSDVTLLDE